MLFSINKTVKVDRLVKGKEEKPDHSASLKVKASGSSVVLLGPNEKLINKLPSIEQLHYYHLHSSGTWSMHELLIHLLKLTGPADVTLSTWAMGEIAVRQLLAAMDSGLITSLTVLVDKRVPLRTPEAYQFLKYQLSNVILMDCHAKVTVIENDYWKVCVTASANMTNNPRIEAYVISTIPEVAIFHRDCILAEADTPKAHKLKE